MIPEENLDIRNGKKMNRNGKYLHKYHKLLSSSKYIWQLKANTIILSDGVFSGWGTIYDNYGPLEVVKY